MNYIDYKPSHKNDIFVELNDNEYQEAMDFGSELYKHSQKCNLRDHRTFVRNGVNGERVQQLGALAESAVSKALGVRWLKGVDTFKKEDLPHNIEVRLIGKENYGLRVYDRDDDSRRVVGIVIEKGQERKPYRIAGWINAKYAKKDIYKIDPLNRGRPVFAVPQEKLFHMNELKGLIEKEIAEANRSNPET
jgi:hypothetical protein